MAELDLTAIAAASIATPSSGMVAVFADNADRKLKTKDDQGVVSLLVNNGRDRSLLTNGGFIIQQRVATASTLIPAMTTSTRAGQVADRWAVTTSVATNLNWAQIDTQNSPETPAARYYGSIIASTAGKKVMISQVLINSEMAHVRGQKVRVSIRINQKVGAAQTYKLGLLYLTSSGTVDVMPAFLTGAWSAVTGTDPAWGTNLTAIVPDAVPVENGTVTGSYLNITSPVTSWQRSSAVFSIPSTAKNLVFVLFSDATGGTTDNLSVTEAQITQGADLVDYQEPPLAESLLRCQRFFCKSFPLTVVPAASVAEATGGSGATGLIGKAGATALAANYSIVFPIVMWKVPTITYFTPTAAGAQCWRFSGAAAAALTATATRASSITDRAVVVTATGEAGGAVGDLVGVHYTAEAEFIT